jgi:subtilisin
MAVNTNASSRRALPAVAAGDTMREACPRSPIALHRSEKGRIARRLTVLATVVSLLLTVGPVNAVAPVQAGPGGSPDARAADRYIVLFREGSDVDGAIGRLSRRVGIQPDHAYRHAVRGFSAHLDAQQLAEVKADPAVALVEADRVVELEAQALPTGVDRVDADLSPAARIDGLDERVDADIAIIDTGIQADHPDLNVAGGYNCTTSNTSDWGDGYGHGTHVAGIAAAKDNEIGVVGVAPGARLWAVRVFDSTGFSLLSWIVCGIDWVTSQKDPLDSSRPLFEAANMSLRDTGLDDGNCGYTNGDAEHQAICRSVAAGTTYAVAAGNDRTDAGQWIPAAYPEVITVSALADFNGQPGGGAPSTCYSFGSWDVDDTFADFSNFGPAVDLIAPGKCIYSTYPTRKSNRTGYAVLSGTSMAAPHVAGAVALYKVGHPTATPSEVQAALQAAGTLDWFTATDPDASPDRLLNVSTFGATAPATVPGAPTLDSATGGAGSVSLAWSAPSSNGGASITNYKIYRGTVAGGEATTAIATVGNVTSYDDSGLAAGTYFYQVSAVNSVGEGAKSDELSGTATTPPPTPAPSVTSVSPASGSTLGGTSVTISGSGFLSGASASMDGSALAGTIVVSATTITGTTGAHVAGPVDVVVTNPDTQTGTCAACYTYADTAPVISGVSASPNKTSAKITWTTDVPADSQVEYGRTSAYGSITLLDTTLVTGHSVNLTGLKRGTTYHYRVYSRNGAGILAVSADFIFNTR